LGPQFLQNETVGFYSDSYVVRRRIVCSVRVRTTLEGSKGSVIFRFEKKRLFCAKIVKGPLCALRLKRAESTFRIRLSSLMREVFGKFTTRKHSYK